jgi:nicotinate-nucleotide adenylyltransferase
MNGIALYGGSFDPPHLGHEAVVKALEKLDFIEKVIIMPTFLNPFKENFTAPAELRLKWLQCIFADDEKVEISAFEVDKKRKVPAIESVQALKKKYEKIYFVIGADNLADLPKWYRYEELRELVTFIVATRDKIAIPKDFLTLKVDIDISSSELRKKIDISKLPKRCVEEIAHYYKEHNAKQN